VLLPEWGVLKSIYDGETKLDPKRTEPALRDLRESVARVVHGLERRLAEPSTTALRLNLESLDDERFEQLLFELLTRTPGYKNVEWLQKTRAPDSGRDVSAYL
jgi:restriction endonuclease Mrr